MPTLQRHFARELTFPPLHPHHEPDRDRSPVAAASPLRPAMDFPIPLVVGTRCGRGPSAVRFMVNLRIKFRQGTWMCVVIALALHSPAASATETKPERPDLTGIVSDAAGAALPEATVFIFTAGPRVGTSTFCPSCYPDCRKNATTDKDGKFKIEALDPNLLFRLLVVGADHKPKFVTKVDPFKEPVRVALDDLDREKYGPKQTLSGRVVGPDGASVFGAAINFELFMGEEANCGGQCEGVDLVAVSDREGRFLITSQKKFDWMTVSVEARGFARRKFFKFASTKTHELNLTEGATVTGRIVKDGRPLQGVAAGLVSVDRSDNFTGNFEVATDESGRFIFPNVPPYQHYFVHGLMDSLKELGCVAVKGLRVTSNGSTKDTGDLAVVPGLRLTGRIVLSDRRTIPQKTRVHIGRQDAWDSLGVELDAEGRFDVKGLPAESFGISLRVPGYTMSLKNKSIDRLNGDCLVGRIDQDTDVLILLEPGRFQPPDFRNGIPPGLDAQPRDKPLQGASMESL